MSFLEHIFDHKQKVEYPKITHAYRFINKEKQLEVFFLENELSILNRTSENQILHNGLTFDFKDSKMAEENKNGTFKFL